MASNDPRRPNILLIVSDDQGPWALGCAGNDELQTPHLDALAAAGVRFENFFCSSPVCSPARASLLTGRMPSAHGVHDWVRGEAYGRPDEGGHHYLEGLTTTPELLSSAGWRCGLVGKWHLGSARTPAPGFEFWYAHRTGDGPYVGAPVITGGTPATEARYFTDAVTEESLEFLAKAAQDTNPFFLSVNYTAPHSPWVGEHPKRWLQLYDDCDFVSCPVSPPHPWFSWEPGPVSEALRDPRPSLQGYFAAVSAMDHGVGRLVHEVDIRGWQSSTLVAFVSDNGFNCGHHGVWGKGNATWPLNLWETSVKVPAIFRQPGVIAQGKVSSALVSSCDLHPTLLDLTGVTAPADRLAAGLSIRPLLVGDPAAERQFVVAFDEYGGTRMIRTRRLKLVTRTADLPTELYDLDADPDEQHNLAADTSRLRDIDELRAVLADWFRAHTDPDLDAYGRPVSGRGQLAPARAGLDDRHTYHD